MWRGPLPWSRDRVSLYRVLVTKKRIEIELDEEQLARLDWLCGRTGKTRQELLQEGVRWVFRTNEGVWDLDDPVERAALDRLQADALPPWDDIPE
jgi:hypothetical protein